MIYVMRVLGFVHQLNNKKDLAEGYVLFIFVCSSTAPSPKR